MDLIRPIAAADLDALLELAQSAGTGFTSLPPNREVLAAKIERSLHSFAHKVQTPGNERYLFVLKNDRGQVVGCSAVEAACGLDEPFYNYHVGLTVHASPTLGVYTRVPTLYLSNDLTGSSVLCSLYLSPPARRAHAGRLLSKCRFLFMAQFAGRFAERVVAELRGVSNARGRSPFWEGLGRHFFTLDYAEAEHTVGRGNKACIAELMPRHPIYVSLLPPEARAVLGQAHPDSRPAQRLLEQEGFRYQQYVDIFDGGPAVEAPRAEIRSVRKSVCGSARVQDALDPSTPLHLLANARLGGFRCVIAPAGLEAGGITLAADAARALQIGSGDALRAAPLV